jgi:virulence-associated protein VagC
MPVSKDEYPRLVDQTHFQGSTSQTGFRKRFDGDRAKVEVGGVVLIITPSGQANDHLFSLSQSQVMFMVRDAQSKAKPRQMTTDSPLLHAGVHNPGFSYLHTHARRRKQKHAHTHATCGDL